ncbi:flavin reductase family protein [Bradyrhizobium canariense]|uniref:NADH-FMN oxidoreductase RutF, flavin reductase (DIM6/NTAB) family n=1 Tax=Bradyrhizobium canariense TaxID=255045 RepID=A0A1H1SNF4_9BRAD|nr:flavin reductase family protein [Bradyrhizobium canariense]SDS49431.1 NADH-FMN oxidoreductase RutF, flavin reductase (DIM6/NTAB) family [Bradyrhizobium canariense]
MPVLNEYASLARSLVSIDAAQFKAAMRCMASTVTVITSREGSVSNGMTATAVCSVSAAPPCILVVINQANKSHSLIERSGIFAVNVLSADQIAIAQHFALKPDDPLGRVDYRSGLTGVPMIEGCAAQLECVVEAQTKSGTHSVFIGRVVFVQETDRLPLIYRGGEFVELSRKSD